mmetsp:Transcript_9552/g.19918  ORF Transcript_9552/g.19918 Transcript_9552/m.19918 type:complete len:243 (+) Transcript_9552:179-907(+)
MNFRIFFAFQGVLLHSFVTKPFIDGHIAGTTGFQPQRQLKIICPHVHRTHQFATESKALSVGVHRHVPDMRMRTAAMPLLHLFDDVHGCKGSSPYSPGGIPHLLPGWHPTGLDGPPKLPHRRQVGGDALIIGQHHHHGTQAAILLPGAQGETTTGQAAGPFHLHHPIQHGSSPWVVPFLPQRGSQDPVRGPLRRRAGRAPKGARHDAPGLHVVSDGFAGHFLLLPQQLLDALWHLQCSDHRR